MYKSDLEWLRGIGWSPLGSLEAEKNKRASEIISEKKYRQPPDRNKFTSIPDAMDIVLAKTNAKNRSDVSISLETDRLGYSACYLAVRSICLVNDRTANPCLF